MRYNLIMEIRDELKAIRMQLEKLTESIRILSGRQNAQHTDVMLKLNELEADKERLDLVVDDAARHIDNLYEQAKRFVIREGKASTSFLQRKLKIGYSRAVMLMDRLEEDFIIAEVDGAKPRKVLVKATAELERGAFTPAHNDASDEDPLYEEVKKLALETGRISTALIQRKCGTGYARAACLMDMLQDHGVIEEGDVAKPRKAIASSS